MAACVSADPSGAGTRCYCKGSVGITAGRASFPLELFVFFRVCKARD